MCHGSIQFWTDDTVDRINARYVLSATIPPEVMDLAAKAASRHVMLTGAAPAVDVDKLALEPPTEVEVLYPSKRDRRGALASSVEDALREADMD